MGAYKGQFISEPGAVLRFTKNPTGIGAFFYCRMVLHAYTPVGLLMVFDTIEEK
jgi:hypothetical protein